MPKRMSLLAEAAIEAALEQQEALDPDLFQKLGASSRSLMDRQSRLLAALAGRLMKGAGAASGGGLGIYCVLEIARSEEEVSPFGVLRKMPVAQVFWSALTSQAEGPVRIFSWTPAAVEIATSQAELDLGTGVCENALILCCSLNPWQVWGKVWAAH